MRRVIALCLAILGFVSVAPVAAQQDQEPCCNVLGFQTFSRSEVTIQLVSVKRTGPNDVTVTWEIRNKSAQPVQFDPMGRTGHAGYQLVWDAEVLDMSSQTRYRIARDPKTQAPVAAKHETRLASEGVALGAGRTLTTWAKFLIPAGVSKVMVSLPGGTQPWENVAVTQ